MKHVSLMVMAMLMVVDSTVICVIHYHVRIAMIMNVVISDAMTLALMSMSVCTISTSTYPWVLKATTEQMKQALVDHGPMDASMGMIGTFTDNIYSCTSNSYINHGVLIVGYDDADGGYWIVKNSWGTGWNDAGYFKVRYDTCSIENRVIYATAKPEYYDVMVYNEGGDTLYVSDFISETAVCWLKLEMPKDGLPTVVMPGGFSGFNIDVDAECVPVGVYTNTIHITSNDTDENRVDVAVTLTVNGGAPDLTLSTVSLSPAPLIAGVPITWEGTVVNEGNVSASASMLTLHTGAACV